MRGYLDYRPDQANIRFRTNQNRRSPQHSRNPRQVFVQRRYPQRIPSGRQQYENSVRAQPKSFNMVPSDIKNHVKFQKIKIEPQDQEKFLNILTKMLEKQIGPVFNVQTQQVEGSRDIQPPYQEINVLVGFKYDMDAYKYTKQDRIFDITYSNKKIDFKPIPTLAFQSLIPILRQRENVQKSRNPQIKLRKPPILKKRNSKSMSEQQRSRRKPKRKRSNYSSSSSKSSKSSESSSKSRHKKRHSGEKIKKRKSSRSNSLSRQSQNDLTSVLIWGIPFLASLKDVFQDLKSIQGGSYQPQRFRWQCVQNSTAVFLKIKLKNRKAENLINIGRRGLTISSYPVVVTPNSMNIRDMKNLLKQYQVALHFPQKVYAYHVYKHLCDVSKVVQICSEYKLSEGKEASFLVTLNSSLIACQLKRMAKVSDVVISSPHQGQLVYRPTKSALILPIK